MKNLKRRHMVLLGDLAEHSIREVCQGAAEYAAHRLDLSFSPWPVSPGRRGLPSRADCMAVDCVLTSESAFKLIYGSCRRIPSRLGIYLANAHHRGTPYIELDEMAIGRMAAEHLLQRGYRRLAFMGSADLRWSNKRGRGFEEVAAAAGVRVAKYELPLARLTAYRQQHSAPDRKLSVNAIFMKAIAHGLAAEPSLNQAITDTGYRQHTSIDVGLAIETPKGVVIAVIEDVDKHDVVALSAQIGKLVAIVRDGHGGPLKPAAACMTISNIGMYRADWFIPIIRPGDAAILGIGSLTERPVVVKGEVAVRLTLPVTLCVDHRIADGAAAARFLKAFAEYLEGLT